MHKKEAKISEPWNLQLLLPKRPRHHHNSEESTTGTPQCITKSSFLRMPLTRSTEISEIL